MYEKIIGNLNKLNEFFRSFRQNTIKVQNTGFILEMNNKK